MARHPVDKLQHTMEINPDLSEPTHAWVRDATDRLHLKPLTKNDKTFFRRTALTQTSGLASG